MLLVDAAAVLAVENVATCEGTVATKMPKETICSQSTNAHEPRRCKTRRPLEPPVRITYGTLDVQCCCHSCPCECCYCINEKKIANTQEMLLWRKNDQRRCNNGRALERLFLPLRMLRLHSSEEEAKADDVFLWHRHACTKTMQKTNGHWGHLCSILLPLLPLRMLLLHSSKEDAKNRRYAPVAKMHMSKDDAKTERAICSCGENAHEQRRCKKRRPLRPLVKIICEAPDVPVAEKQPGNVV